MPSVSVDLPRPLRPESSTARPSTLDDPGVGAQDALGTEPIEDRDHDPIEQPEHGAAPLRS